MCRYCADDVDLDVVFTNYPFAIMLAFNVIGSDIKVQFNCTEIEGITLEKDWNDQPLYVVLGVSVTPPKLNRNPDQSDHEFSCIDR